MTDRRLVFVVNPRSAAGATLRRFEGARHQLTQRCKAKGFEVDVRLTERPRHATELARAAVVSGVDAVIAVGGDGTNNEVINGFFDEAGVRLTTNTAFGVVTSGTGGDFRRAFGWTTRISDDIDRLLRFQRRRIDLGELTCTPHEGTGTVVRHFINISSFGLSGVVVDIANNSSKRFGAKLSFMKASVEAMATYQPQRVRLQLDDALATVEDIALVAVSNGQYFGGGMWVAPNAVPDDGLFDGVVITGGGLPFWLRHSLKIYTGRHTDLDVVRIVRCRRVHAEPEGGARVQIDLDGEQPGVLPATWSIVPATLDLLV